MSETFEFYVTRSQIAVFDPDLEDPLNDWRGIHVAQGFAWRSASVSFGTLADSGRLVVAIRQSDQVQVESDAVRAIVVPFTVPPSGRISVSDMAEDESALLPPGYYALLFETGYLTDDPVAGMWVRLSFAAEESVEPAILRADPGLNPPDILDMDADPV